MILLAKLGVGVLGTALVGSAALSSEGFVHVRVHEKAADGTHLSLIVPAVMVPAVLGVMPRHHLARAAAKLRTYLPVVDAALPAIERCPDGVLVEVINPKEHVVVAKAGDSVVVDVNDAEETVHVALPLRAAQSSLHEIASAGGPI
jgi:hypothetical protein